MLRQTRQMDEHKEVNPVLSPIPATFNATGMITPRSEVILIESTSNILSHVDISRVESEKGLVYILRFESEKGLSPSLLIYT